MLSMARWSLGVPEPKTAYPPGDTNLRCRFFVYSIV